jgi:AcrR family transcriptional regulator
MASRPKNLTAEERRNTTIEAVVDLAATTNPEEITTSAIAGHMNLTQGALFRHFPTKDAIWQGVMNWLADRLLARIDQAAGRATSPLAALEAMFLGHVDFVAEHPGVPRMMIGQLQRAEMTPAKLLAQNLMTNYAARLRRLLCEARQNGTLPADLDDQAAATLFLGMIQGLVVQSLLSGRSEQMRADAPKVFAIYRAGLLRGATGGEEGL